MQSFAFEVAVRCPLELAFEIYIDIDRWRNRSIFGEIRWVKGSPWQEGSRLTIETRLPFRSLVDQSGSKFYGERERQLSESCIGNHIGNACSVCQGFCW